MSLMHIFLLLFVPIHSASGLYATWNGTKITGPIVIFQDEIRVLNSNGTISNAGVLACQSQSNLSVAGWYFPDSSEVPSAPATVFQQTRESTNISRSLLSRLSAGSDASDHTNGIWMCRLNGSEEGQVPIGIYRRESHRGILTTASILLLSSESYFMRNPPVFAIMGMTRGGPPTDRSWTKDGMILNNTSLFNISLEAIPQNSEIRYRDSIYENVLTVTGRHPGLYQYTVTNPLSSIISDRIIIEVADTPSDLMVHQIGANMVEIMWTAPLTPPRRGYLLAIAGLSGVTKEIFTDTSPHRVSLVPDVYSIRLQALSEHYPSEVVGPVNITVRGLLLPVVTVLALTPTSISMNLTQLEGSLPIDMCSVSLMLADRETQLCQHEEEEDGNTTFQQLDTSIDFVDLLEFSVYNLTVSVANNAYRSSMSFSFEFTTLSTLPTGPPQNITFTKSSRSIVFSWMPIICSQCNGPITSYSVEFESADGVLNASIVIDETFSATDLTPDTNYTFRVAGINSNGSGPFSDVITILTNQDTPGVVSNFQSELGESSVMLSWSAPQEPNGVIISYEVTYRVNDSEPVQFNTTGMTTTVTIRSLPPGTIISNISVNAYTIVGRGETAQLEAITIVLPQIFSINFVSIAGLLISFLIVIVGVLMTSVIVSKIRWCRKSSNQQDQADLFITRIGPVIEKFPEDTNAIEGENVSIRVSVAGHPKPTITWYFEDNPLQPDSSIEIQPGGSMFITFVQVKHGGLYRMVAKNSIGTAQRSFNLYIRLRELRRILTLDNDDVVINPIHLDKFGEYVANNHLHDDKGFKSQFMVLFSGQIYSKFIGTHSKNVKLNRYANITVYDHNRIALNPIAEGDDLENFGGDFINASYVDGYLNPHEFIATQGPKLESIIDFWRLVWQERPPTIVMVTNLKEGNKRKCDQYWPDSGSINYGPFKVTHMDQEVLADYIIRTFLITLSSSSRLFWEVRQYQFLSWSDHGLPEYTSLMVFHKDVTTWHNNVDGPMLVHCSAGVGRTGSFICLDIVLKQVKKERIIDIAGTINKMRHQRMKMVHLLEQYIFLHDIILKYIQCGSTEMSTANIKKTIKKWLRPESTTGHQSMLEKQFQVLEQTTPKQQDVQCMAALENPDKNRSKDFLPADKYRVVLNGESSDYIHAVYVNGYNRQKAYIIGENPMRSTVRNVYKVLSDNRCGAIIMLSNLSENSKECCFQYWPTMRDKMATFDDIRVYLINEEQALGITTRILKIMNLKTNQYHQLIQFHITTWNSDGQCSNVKGIMEVMEEVTNVQKRTGNAPIFVHCSNTVTRSAMFCAIVTIIDRWKTEGLVDIFQVLKDIRVQKPGAVPTLSHYQTIYSLVLLYLSNSDKFVCPPSPTTPTPSPSLSPEPSPQ